MAVVTSMVSDLACKRTMLTNSRSSSKNTNNINNNDRQAKHATAMARVTSMVSSWRSSWSVVVSSNNHALPHRVSLFDLECLKSPCTRKKGKTQMQICPMGPCETKRLACTGAGVQVCCLWSHARTQTLAAHAPLTSSPTRKHTRSPKSATPLAPAEAPRSSKALMPPRPPMQEVPVAVAHLRR